MDAGRHQLVKKLFIEVADLDDAARAMHLDAACANDAALRAEVERLVAHDRAPPRLLADHALRGRGAGRAATPERIGPFRIIGLLGQGGMGTVYEAQQEQPLRQIALKVLHPWLDTPQLQHRFERETRLLRRLDHPGIPRILDAGVVETPMGRQPFIAMDLVDGLPITDFARRHGLDANARLNLIALVCDAVEHAHARDVVHRDLKPANVLVDVQGQPRVLDFGIARVADGAVDMTSLGTESQAILGTVPYMSPEQAAGRSHAVDARSDVYSLGVLAYELLTGELPLDVRSRSVVDALRVIVDVEPTPAGERDTMLRGNVETILAKMLEKEPERRYASAAAVAADIRSHLARLPIRARPRSIARQWWQIAKRHKGLSAGLAATIVSLGVGLGASIHYALAAADGREAALAGEQAAQRQAYRANMLLASMSLGSGNLPQCRRLLDAAPEALRNFEWRHLDRTFDTSLATYAGSAGPIKHVTFGPDGTTLIVPDSRRTLRTWKRARTEDDSGAPPLETTTFDGELLALAARGAFIVWQSDDRSLHVTDRVAHREVAHIDGVDAIATFAEYAPATGRLVVLFADRIALWDAHAGRLLANRQLPRGAFVRPAFDAGGARLALPDTQGEVMILDAMTGVQLTSFRCKLAARVAAWSPNGSILATSGDATATSLANCVELRDAETMEVRSTLSGHAGFIRAITFSTDGTRIATCSTDRSIRLWNTADGACLDVLLGSRSTSMSVNFAPDDRELVAGASDGTARIFATEPTATAAEADVLHGHTKAVYPIAFQPGGALLASGSWDHSVRLWDVGAGVEVALLAGHTEYVHSLAFSPDGARLLSSSYDRTCRVWDVNTRSETARIELEKGLDVNAVAWSPDGSKVALGSGVPNPRVWIVDARSLAPVCSFEFGKGFVGALAFAADSATLVCGDSTGRVSLHDAGTGAQRVERDFGFGAVQSLAFAHFSDRLVAATASGPLVLVDPAALVTLMTMPGHRGEAFCAQFSPDDSRIASGGRDGVVRLWDSASGEVVAELARHGDFVWSVAFSPDGQRIASGSGDATIRLWETKPLRDRILARRKALATLAMPR